MRWIIIRVVFIAVLALNVAGCAELRRKFTPKSKPTEYEPSFYRIKQYQPKPPHERYQESYILWHNWHTDLLRTEGTSRKRDINAATEALRHLTAMRDLLVEEKAKELDGPVADMEAVLERLKARRRNVLEDTQSRKTIERLERVIINMYSYGRMKNYIKSESQLGGGEG